MSGISSPLSFKEITQASFGKNRAFTEAVKTAMKDKESKVFFDGEHFTFGKVTEKVKKIDLLKHAIFMKLSKNYRAKFEKASEKIGTAVEAYFSATHYKKETLEAIEKMQKNIDDVEGLQGEVKKCEADIAKTKEEQQPIVNELNDIQKKVQEEPSKTSSEEKLNLAIDHEDMKFFEGFQGQYDALLAKVNAIKGSKLGNPDYEAYKTLLEKDEEIRKKLPKELLEKGYEEILAFYEASLKAYSVKKEALEANPTPEYQALLTKKEELLKKIEILDKRISTGEIFSKQYQTKIDEKLAEIENITATLEKETIQAMAEQFSPLLDQKLPGFDASVAQEVLKTASEKCGIQEERRTVFSAIRALNAVRALKLLPDGTIQSHERAVNASFMRALLDGELNNTDAMNSWIVNKTLTIPKA